MSEPTKQVTQEDIVSMHTASEAVLKILGDYSPFVSATVLSMLIAAYAQENGVSKYDFVFNMAKVWDSVVAASEVAKCESKPSINVGTNEDI